MSNILKFPERVLPDIAQLVIDRHRALPDFTFSHHGTIGILIPLSEAATTWCDEHLPEVAQRWAVRGYVVEHGYIEDIVLGLRRDGLTVR